MTCSVTPTTSPPSGSSSVRRRTRLWPNMRCAICQSRSACPTTSQSWSSHCPLPCADACRVRQSLKPSCGKGMRTRIDAGSVSRCPDIHFQIFQASRHPGDRVLPGSASLSVPTGPAPPPSRPLMLGRSPRPPRPAAEYRGHSCRSLSGSLKAVAPLRPWSVFARPGHRRPVASDRRESSRMTSAVMSLRGLA